MREREGDLPISVRFVISGPPMVAFSIEQVRERKYFEESGTPALALSD